MNLRTERLTLAMTTEGDLSDLSALVTNEYVRKYLFDDEVLDTHQVQNILSQSIESFKHKGYGIWIIHCCKTTGDGRDKRRTDQWKANHIL